MNTVGIELMLSFTAAIATIALAALPYILFDTFVLLTLSPVQQDLYEQKVSCSRYFTESRIGASVLYGTIIVLAGLYFSAYKLFFNE